MLEQLRGAAFVAKCARRSQVDDPLRNLEKRGVERRHHGIDRFELTFRTLTVPQMTARLERAGFVVERILGDYRGQPWDAGADVWIILATRRR